MPRPDTCRAGARHKGAATDGGVSAAASFSSKAGRMIRWPRRPSCPMRWGFGSQLARGYSGPGYHDCAGWPCFILNMVPAGHCSGQHAQRVGPECHWAGSCPLSCITHARRPIAAPRGLVATDWQCHIRGGFLEDVAKTRETLTGNRPDFKWRYRLFFLAFADPQVTVRILFTVSRIGFDKWLNF